MSNTNTTHWVAYEKNTAVLLGEVISESNKNILLKCGDKIPRRRVWINPTPPACPALYQKIDEVTTQLSAKSLWQIVSRQPLTLSELSKNIDSNAEAIILQIAVLQIVLANPVYFRRHNATIEAVEKETLTKALESLQLRQQQQQYETDMLTQLAQQQVPADISNNQEMLLYAPEKSSMSYRVLKKHLGADGVSFARFFLNHHLLTSEHDYLHRLFRHEWPAPPATTDNTQNGQQATPTLPNAPQLAFSIDETDTIEIDDAFSVCQHDENRWRVGIHIVAPALALSPESWHAASTRQISVYFPDQHYYMLPRATIAACSLARDAYRPVISLYLEIENDNWRVSETVVENIRLAHTLTPHAVDRRSIPPDLLSLYEKLKHTADLLAPNMSSSHSEQNYKIDIHNSRVQRRERTGCSRVVEILMRTANSIWAQKIAEENKGGLFRENGKIKLRAGTVPYMWLTSPLRRYVDLLNQRLLLTVLNHAPAVNHNWPQAKQQFDRLATLARRWQHIHNTYWALRILQTQAPSMICGEYTGGKRVHLYDYPLSGNLSAPLAHLPVPSPINVAIENIDLLTQQLSLSLLNSTPAAI